MLKQCSRPGCSVQFRTERDDKVYCSIRCRHLGTVKRHQMKKRLQERIEPPPESGPVYVSNESVIDGVKLRDGPAYSCGQCGATLQDFGEGLQCLACAVASYETETVSLDIW